MKEVKMFTTIAPTADRSRYATEANPTLQRHHWQHLASMVYSLRPEWAVSEIIEKLWLCRNMQTFPELARIALAVALDPRHTSPAGIHFVAAGVIAL
jgi:hypothetical protein